MSLGSNIRFILGLRGEAAANLARAANVGYTTIKNLIDRDSKTSDAAPQIAAVWGIDLETLLRGSESDIRRWHDRAGTVAIHGGDAMHSGDVVIPQYNTGGKMGHGLVLRDQPGIIKSWHVSPDWVRLNVPAHSGVENLCIVTGFGPSMMPMFNPGDPLLLDRGVTRIEFDAVYFFALGNEGFIKSVQRVPEDGAIRLRAKSKNPDYDPFWIDENMGFQVFGRILRVWKGETI